MYILDEVDAALDLSHTQVGIGARSTKDGDDIGLLLRSQAVACGLSHKNRSGFHMLAL